VTLKLPADVAMALSQRAKQLGQLPSQVLVDAVRLGLGLSQIESARTVDEWQQVHDRLAALEALVPIVYHLQALVEPRLLERPDPSAFPDSAFPDSALTDAATLSPAVSPAKETGGMRDRCPRCDHRLGPPLKASGRQVCGKCGWSDKPRRPESADIAADLAPDDVSRLLSQAAQESLNNMKPKPSEPPLPKTRSPRRSLFPNRE
jgi:ribosomal protein S27AE